jgi:beta-fructofuranosidase
VTLRLPEHWVWDFWTAQEEDRVHVFFLYAPRSLGDPDLRHYASRIGHAVSSDLRTWTVLPEALGPSEEPRFDDRAVWTGSVLRHGDDWLMFYTGASHADAGPVQRIGMVMSRDLLTWRWTPVCIEADPRWYEKAGDVSTEEHWRDPWALQTPDGVVHLLVTARVPDGDPDERGVIGHAWSTNLVDWSVGPPLSEPGAFRQLEVPQVVEFGGHWHLLASLGARDHGGSRRAMPGFSPISGTFTAPAESPLGPFHLESARTLLADLRGSQYAARVVPWKGTHKLLAWRNVAPDGSFIGELSDPMDLRLNDEGELEVVRGAFETGAGPEGASHEG